ncbi:OmpA family protein [Spirillospora albida]|uniref:OmpA family protein n=1 Tax=Spirillospora albida TaxID=58123 RepID=UPI0004BEC3DC|nr:OmpA family protein [Spirillospora albida]
MHADLKPPRRAFRRITAVAATLTLLAAGAAPVAAPAAARDDTLPDGRIVDGTGLKIGVRGSRAPGAISARFADAPNGMFCCGPGLDSGYSLTSIRMDGVLYNAESGLEQSSAPALTGTGTAADPWTVTSGWDVGDTPLDVTQKVTHVNGTRRYTISWTLAYSGEGTPTVRLSHGADLAIGTDTGAGSLDAGPPRVLRGRATDGTRGALVERTPWTHFFEGFFLTATEPLTSVSAPDLPDTYEPAVVDNGVAVQWDRVVSSAAPVTVAVGWRFAPPPVPRAVPRVAGLPSGSTRDTTANVTFFPGIGDELVVFSYQCRLDDAEWEACGSTGYPYSVTDLADGRHTLRIRALNSVGRHGPAKVATWTVDTTAAAPAVVGRPDDSPATGGAVAFGGEEGAMFECSLDSGAYADCESPWAVTGLAEGAHTAKVRQVDAAGNISEPATAAWTVTDSPAAETPAGPSVVTAPAAVTGVSGTGLTVGCGLSSGRIGGCDLTLTASRAAVRGAGTSGRAPERVVVGTGTATFPGSAASGGVAVPVTLNAIGRRLAQRPGGTPVRLSAEIRPVGSATVLRAAATTKLVRPRLVVAGGSLTFEPGSSTLKPSGVRYLDALSRDLIGVRSLECVGHTDGTGRAGANKRLARARARTVCAHLTRGSEIKSRIVSWGEQRPRASNSTAHGRALNNRTEINLDYR